MNAIEFLNSFPFVVKAANGTECLRQMIYNLGITGALSEQRKEDGDGQSLLGEIEALRDEMITNKTFKRSTKLEKVGEDFAINLPAIPANWVWTRLVDIGMIGPRNTAEDDVAASFAPMATISEYHRVAPQPEIRPWGKIKKGYTHFADGDVAVAKITPCFENGKAAVMANLENGIGAGTTELIVFRPIGGFVLPEFVYLFLRSPYFTQLGRERMTGTAGQKRLPTEYVAARPFPLPPLKEQRRIVRKVDELMKLCDKLEQQQQERSKLFPLLSHANHTRLAAHPSPTHLSAIFTDPPSLSPEDMRKTIRELAVRGNLVPQLIAEGNSEDMLAEASKCRTKLVDLKLASKPKKLQPIDATPFPIPSSWSWIRLGALTLTIDYGTSKRADLNSANVPVFRMGNISNGQLETSSLKYVPPEIDDLPRLYLRKNDILFNRTNSAELVGKAAIYKGTENTHTFASYLIRLRLPDLVEADYFNLCFQTRYFRSTQIEPELTQQCGQANFNGTKLANTLFPVPPRSEQRRIMKSVDHLIQLVNELDSKTTEVHSVSQLFAISTVDRITQLSSEVLGK